MKKIYFLTVLFCQLTFSQNWVHYSQTDNLVNGFINSLEKFNNNYYACTWTQVPGETNGLGKFDGANWTKISDVNLHFEIRNLFNDNNGNLWISTHNGLTKYDGNQFIKYTTVDGLPSNYIFKTKKDNNGVLWITTNNGVAKFSNGIFTTLQELNGKSVLDLEFISSNKIWFTVANEGIYQKENNIWTTINISNGLSSNDPQVIKKGNNSDIWIGNYNNSFLDKYDTSLSTFTHYNSLNGLPSAQSVQVRTIEKDVNGFMYFGTNNGLTKFDGTTFSIINTNGPASSNIVRAILFDSSELWIGTWAGVSRSYNFLSIDSNHITKSEILISPNPTKNFITILDKRESIDFFYYNIVDLTGRLIKTGISKFNEQINIENLTNGNYIIKIQTDKEEKLIEKLIKN